MVVAVIGGSLSGLAFALACARHGIPTRVFEHRQANERSGGATLGVDRDLLLRVTGRSEDEIDAVPFPALTSYRKALSWQSLHGWLRAQALRCDQIELIDGTTIVEVSQEGGYAAAKTLAGPSISADVIIGADGYRSILRPAVDPIYPQARYAGYLLWRGLVSEGELPARLPFPTDNDGIALTNVAGDRLVAFPVAGDGGSLRRGERAISFTWYDARHSDLLRNLGCVSENGHVLSSLTPETTPRLSVSALVKLAVQLWPRPWLAAVLHALEQGRWIGTPAAEYCPNRLQRERLAIIGDAAHVVSPVTGQGFRVGLLDAEALADCLASSKGSDGDAVRSALRRYEAKRLAPAQRLAAESMRWSRAFVEAFQVKRENR